MLVEGRRGQPNKTITVRAASAVEAELDAADLYPKRWCRVVETKKARKS